MSNATDAHDPSAREARTPPQLRQGGKRESYRYFAGRIIARHMWATGLLS